MFPSHYVVRRTILFIVAAVNYDSNRKDEKREGGKGKGRDEMKKEEEKKSK